MRLAVRSCEEPVAVKRAQAVDGPVLAAFLDKFAVDPRLIDDGLHGFGSMAMYAADWRERERESFIGSMSAASPD
jgi:hypothetical protein